MKKNALCLLLVLFCMIFYGASLAWSHSVWINTFVSDAHKPPHAMVSLGWGHALPMDDILNSPNGRIAIETFEMYDPALKKTSLLLPEPKIAEPKLSTDNADLFAADLAAQKIAFKKESANGVYQFAAVSKPTFYTQYIDTNGKMRMQLKPKNELDDIKKVLMSVKYQAFAKSYATVGEWKTPESLGLDLEIIPKTDLYNVSAGDLVEVEVLFMGKPVETTAKSMNYITAHGTGFGQSEGFFIGSYVMHGKAQFRVQSAGQWLINLYHKEDVTKDGPTKDLFGKADVVYHSASVTFIVK